MWTKYDYLCTDCDALHEITTLEDIKNWRGWCPCGSANLVLLGTADATVKLEPYDEPYEPVIKVTAPQVVKINTNPYNL